MSIRSPARSSWTRASFLTGTAIALLSPFALLAWVGAHAPAPQVYATGIGELRRVVLGQHAITNLNTRTELSVGATPVGCNIVLKSGEALFEVRRNDGRLVHVAAGNVIVAADAAAFAVRLRDPDAVDVLVRKGTVTLADSARRSGSVTLTANHKAHVSHKGVTLEQFSDAEMQRRLEWTTGYLSFRGETLQEVAEEFNRYNPQQLVVEDRAIRHLRIGGKFQSTDPEGFVAALRPMGVQRAEAAPASGASELIRLVGTRVR
jgi:transmembrane sensor